MPRLPLLPRPRLSYANICSTAALVVALGTGTAYAASITSGDIIDGEVKRPDLATNAVDSLKIINGGIRPHDVREDSLTGAQLADGTISGADLGESSVGSEELLFDSVGSSEIRTDAVGQTEVAPNAIDSDEISDGTLTADDLDTGSVRGEEVANSSLTGSDVANDGLTMSDIAGGGINNGLVSFTSISTGRCVEVNIAILGAATPGDGVVLTTQRDMPNGVFLYATEVSASDNVRAVLCNMSGSASPAITDLPVRIHTFR